MRSLVIAAVVATLAFSGTAADAQRIGPQGNGRAGGWRQPMPAPPAPMPRPNPGKWQGNQPRPMPQPRPGGWKGGQWQWQGNGQWQGGNRGQWNGRSRWGNRIGGYWWAGMQAPGGWNGYVRLKRGKHLPSYWLSPNYIISDWQMFGLGAPPAGYYWSRYYNDAVLIDASGAVYDSIGSVDWDRYQGGYAYDDEYAGGDGYADYPPAGYPAPPPGPGYGAPYPAPGYGGSSSSTTTYTTTTGGYAGGYPGGPMPRIPYGETYYVSPGSVVTVTMPGAVTTTTTTTTYIEERAYVAPKRVYRKVIKRKWRPRPKPRCTCAPAPIRGS